MPLHDKLLWLLPAHAHAPSSSSSPGMASGTGCTSAPSLRCMACAGLNVMYRCAWLGRCRFCTNVGLYVVAGCRACSPGMLPKLAQYNAPC